MMLPDFQTPSFADSCISFLSLIQRGLVIRYVEKLHVQRLLSGPEYVQYRIDLVTTNGGEQFPDRYLWLSYVGVQHIQDGVRGVFDRMSFERNESGAFQKGTCPTLVENWQAWTPHFLRTWPFVGITSLERKERFVGSDLLCPQDAWVQRQLAIILGMLYQSGKLAFELGIADELGRFMKDANRKAAQVGIRQ
ncbi:MAG: hypothetical protein PHI73_00590 [Patescibacteria group bacterium]|nr:hypothetical protein [Patescibacteria group bacterium]